MVIVLACPRSDGLRNVALHMTAAWTRPAARGITAAIADARST
jgi:hypothetical protein